MIYIYKRNLAFIFRIIDTMSRPKKPKSEHKALTAGPTGGPDPAGGKRSINHWLCLSDEVVLSIFRLLPQEDLVTISLISKRFSHLSKDPSLWTQLTLDYENIKQNAESCRKLVDRCKKLTDLNITNNSLNFSKLNIMTVVTRAKERLESLEVDDSMSNWTPAAMSKLGSLKNLTRLSMSFNSDSKSANSYAGAEMLEELKNLDKLEVLNLELRNYHSSHVDSFAVLESVFQQLKKLKEVKLYPPCYGENLVIALAKNNPDLKVIWGKVFSSFSDETIEVLVNSCPALEDITISSSHSESEINKISSSWPNLKILEVRGFMFGGIDHKDEKLIGYAEKFRSLERLVLDIWPYDNVTDSGIERLVNSAKKLKYLFLVAPKVTKDLVKRLKTEYPNLALRINNY